jgi:hypothetical protein
MFGLERRRIRTLGTHDATSEAVSQPLEQTPPNAPDTGSPGAIGEMDLVDRDD